MLTRLIVGQDLQKRKTVIDDLIKKAGFLNNHPDLLKLEEDKLGVAEAKKIREHLSLKPFSGNKSAVIVYQADQFSADAQNSLLKTLEEPPLTAIIILGTSSEEQILPTIISRCEIINLDNQLAPFNLDEKQINRIKQLLITSKKERIQIIEKLDDREAFLKELIVYFRQQLLDETTASQNIVNFIKDLIEAERWAKQNVNIRAILEYLMLKMPNPSSQKTSS